MNTREVLLTHKDQELVFLVADGSANLSGRNYELQEPTLRREYTVRRENLSGASQGDREEFQLEETKDDERINIFGLTQKLGKNSIPFNVIILNREVLLHVPRKSFLIPLSDIDFIRSTCADLEIARENIF